MSGKRISKGIVISWIACLWLSAAGCAGGHHRLALMHRLRRPCLDAPPIAEVPFYGYHASCWHKWPEGWVSCPENAFEESELLPVSEPIPAEPMPAEPMLDEPMLDEPMLDEPMPDEPMPDEPMPDEPMPDEPMPGPAAETEMRGVEKLPATGEPSPGEPDSARLLDLMDPNARHESRSANMSMASYIHVEPPRKAPAAGPAAAQLTAGLWDPVKARGRRAAGLTLRR